MDCLIDIEEILKVCKMFYANNFEYIAETVCQRYCEQLLNNSLYF